MKRATHLLSFLFAVCLVLSGHELSPTSLNLTIGGPAGKFTLSNGGGETDCTTTISLDVQGSAVTVQPTVVQYSTPPDSSATFTVTPVKPGTAVITVNWIAGTSPTCNGSGRPTVSVTVADIPPPPTAVQEKEVIEPVSMANGAELNSWVDLRLRGPLPLYFERYYYSALQPEGQVSSALGPNWMHNYDLKLSVSGTAASVTYYHGQSIRFVKNGSSWIQTSPDPLAYQLAQSGTSYKMLDPVSKLIYTFDGGTGQLQSIQDRNGNTNSFAYTNNQLTQVTDGLGGMLTFAYSGNNLTSVTDQSGRSIGFTYANGALATFTDAGGKTTTYSYTGAALLTSVRLPRGNTPYTQAYDSTGKVTTSQNASSYAYSFSFNGTNGQSTMTDPLSEVSTYIHSGRNLTQQTDPAGNVTSFTYDSNSRLTSQQDGNGSRTTFSYTGSGFIAAITYPDGGQLSLTYTGSALNGFTYYDLTRIAYPDGSTETFQYDSNGNVIARTGRNGQRWTATYNSLGQPLTLTAPNTGTIVFTYSQDGSSTPATVQYPDTDPVTLNWDKLKRLVSRVWKDGTTVSYAYDAYDHLVSKTDETGAVTTATYDANGLPATITDAAGGTISYTRTGSDNLAAATDAAGRQVTLLYDRLDRYAGLGFADGSTFQVGYDAAGNVVSLTDGEGKTWRQGFDKAGNVTSLTTPLGAKTVLTLDAMGRTTSAVTPAGKKVSFQYDSMGRLTAITDALNNVTSFTYDKAGALASVAIPGGIAAQYQRDAMEHVTRVTDGNGNQWQYAYDKLGRLLSFTDPLGHTSSYQRDGKGHITGQTTPLGTLALTLDADGRPTHAAYSDGTAFDYTRDAAGRLTSTTQAAFQFDASGFLSSSNGLSLQRDQLARITQVTLAPGKTIQYTYDRRGLCTQVKDWAGGVTTLQYDDASHLISIVRPNGVTTSYTYDPDGDVATIKEGALSSISLTRDLRGLVTQAVRNVPVSPTPAQLANAQTLHTFSAASQVADFPYDAMGRRLSDETRTYIWDLASHLTQFAAVDGTTSAQTYDGLGLIATQSIGGINFQFVWNHGLAIPSISVVRSGGTDSLYYIHTPDGQLLYSVNPANQRRFYHYDEQGNTIFLTDDSGAITDKFAYTEYGALLAPASSNNLFLFGGRYGTLYLGSGLYSMRQRVYDSITGSFLAPDPKSHLAPHLINPYGYAAGNPLLFTDFTGADPSTGGSAPVGTTAPDIVSGAGTVAGTLDTELTAAANHTQQLIEMVDFENEGLKGAQQALRGTRFVGKVRAVSGPLNTLSNVGTAAQVVSIGINTYNLNNGINQAESEDDRNRNGAYQTYQNTVAAVQDLYRKGKITAVQKNNLMLQANFNYDEALMNLDNALMDSLLYEGFNFFTSSMAQIPYVNDAAIAIGNQFYK